MPGQFPYGGIGSSGATYGGGGQELARGNGGVAVIVWAVERFIDAVGRS